MTSEASTFSVESPPVNDEKKYFDPFGGYS